MNVFPLFCHHPIFHLQSRKGIIVSARKEVLLKVHRFIFQVTDMPEEDLLSHFEESNAFIADCLAKEGAVLIHCYRGRSRSATVVVAFLMQKHGYSAERALAKVRNRREIIQPHDSFLAQLKLFENMDFTIDPANLQFKMFR